MNIHTSKVLLCVNTTWNVYNFRSGLIERLIRDGYGVTVVTPRNTGDDSRITALGCKHVFVDLQGRSKNPLKEAWTFLQYLKILKAEKPDCVLLFTIKPNLYMGLACKLLEVPYINNITGLGTIFLRDGWLSFLVKKVYQLALSASSRVFFQNTDDQKLFIEGYMVSPSAVGLLPGSGVNLEKFSFSPFEYGQSTQRPFKFLLAARLLWSKGIAEYVEAARLLKLKGYQAEFQLLGFVDSNDREVVSLEKINAWAVEGLISYKGHADNIYPHLVEADCVVLPTFYREGTPKVLLEAMAVGRPIITTNVPGCRDVLDVDENGFLCEVRDAKSLAEAMEKIMQLPPSKLAEMGANSRRKVEYVYDEKFVQNIYADAIESAIKT